MRIIPLEGMPHGLRENRLIHAESSRGYWLLMMRMHGFSSNGIWAHGAIETARATGALRARYLIDDDNTREMIRKSLESIQQNSNRQ